MNTIRVVLPAVESGKVYAPNELALEVLNLQRTPDNTLKSVRGPCPYIPDYGDGFPSQYSDMHGIYHASLDSGMRDVLLIRTGERLIEQTGWTRGVRTLVGPGGVFSTRPLSNEPNAKFPDQFCEVGGKIVWTNGVDHPLAYDGYLVLPLGYTHRPHAPTGVGPTAEFVATGSVPDGGVEIFASEDVLSNKNPALYRNAGGYSHPGRKGTPGDALQGQVGAVLGGAFLYYVQFEDAFGNRSPMSPASNSVELRTEQTATDYNNKFLLWDEVLPLRENAVQLDDLTKQFAVLNLATGPEGTVARLVFCTPDTRHDDPTPLLLVRIPDNSTTMFPDNASDAELGAPAVDYMPVPTFKLMCPYRGGLAAANTTTNPGLLLLSDAGLPGSFQYKRTLVPDPNGGEITMVAVFNGELYVATLDTIFNVIDDAEGLRAKPIHTGAGCVAPSSARMTGWGELVWLGRDGLYRLTSQGVSAVSADNDEDFQTYVSRTGASRAVAVYNPDTREYLCAVTMAGAYANGMLLAYDGTGVRRQNHGISYRGLCCTKDARRLVLGCGKNMTDGDDNVFVLDRETQQYAPPTKTHRFKSSWLRLDPTGRDKANIHTIYVGMVESTHTDVTIRTYINGRRGVVRKTGIMRAVPVDTTQRWDNLVLASTTTLPLPRLFWMAYDCQLQDVESFAFDLETPSDSETSAYLHLASFAFDATLLDNKGGRVPRVRA